MVHCYELPKLNSSQKKNKIKIMLNFNCLTQSKRPYHRGSFIYYVRKILRKTKISYPLIRTRVRKVIFFRKFCERNK